MRFRIETLGPFKLVDLQKGTAIPLRSNARLLSYLATRSPQFTPRRNLASEAWPDVDPTTAANRLRVALSKLRQIMPGAILQEGEALALDPAVVESDVAEFLEKAREADDSSQEGDELEARLEAAKLFREPQFPLAEPLDVFYKTAVRLAELGPKLNRDAAIAETVARALKLWPQDATLWKAYLRIQQTLGQAESAARELAETKDKNLLQNKEIRQLLSSMLGEKEPTSKLTEGLLKTIVECRPDLARPILCSPETLSLAGAHPKEMLSLLERVVQEPMPADPHWERCMARIVGLKAWVGEPQGVFDYGRQIVETSQDPVILRATWNAIAIAHSLRREWPETMQAIETTIAFAEQTGNEIDVLSAQGNRAYFLWHQCRFEESLADYNQSLAKIQTLDSDQARFEYTIGHGNRAFIPVMQGNWPLALEWLEESQELRAQAKIPMGILLPCLAMVRMILGQRESVLPMLRQGFLEASAHDWDRYLQITFEFAACALAQTKDRAFARSVIDWVGEWRTRTRLPRAEAENELFERILGDQWPEVYLSPEDPPKNVGREVLRRLRLSLPD